MKRYEPKSREGLVRSLEFAFKILNDHYIFLQTEEGKQRLKVSINKYNTNHRPGMGLGRGFGEIDYQNSAIQREIMDTIWAIEDYFKVLSHLIK